MTKRFKVQPVREEAADHSIQVERTDQDLLARIEFDQRVAKQQKWSYYISRVFLLVVWPWGAEVTNEDFESEDWRKFDDFLKDSKLEHHDSAIDAKLAQYERRAELVLKTRYASDAKSDPQLSIQAPSSSSPVPPNPSSSVSLPLSASTGSGGKTANKSCGSEDNSLKSTGNPLVSDHIKHMSRAEFFFRTMQVNNSISSLAWICILPIFYAGYVSTSKPADWHLGTTETFFPFIQYLFFISMNVTTYHGIAHATLTEKVDPDVRRLKKQLEKSYFIHSDGSSYMTAAEMIEVLEVVFPNIPFFSVRTIWLCSFLVALPRALLPALVRLYNNQGFFAVYHLNSSDVSGLEIALFFLGCWLSFFSMTGIYLLLGKIHESYFVVWQRSRATLFLLRAQPRIHLTHGLEKEWDESLPLYHPSYYNYGLVTYLDRITAATSTSTSTSSSRSTSSYISTSPSPSVLSFPFFNLSKKAFEIVDQGQSILHSRNPYNIASWFHVNRFFRLQRAEHMRALEAGFAYIVIALVGFLIMIIGIAVAGYSGRITQSVIAIAGFDTLVFALFLLRLLITGIDVVTLNERCANALTKHKTACLQEKFDIPHNLEKVRNYYQTNSTHENQQQQQQQQQQPPPSEEKKESIYDTSQIESVPLLRQQKAVAENKKDDNSDSSIDCDDEVGRGLNGENNKVKWVVPLVDDPGHPFIQQIDVTVDALQNTKPLGVFGIAITQERLAAIIAALLGAITSVLGAALLSLAQKINLL